jgi:hypothetical protein
MRYVKLFEEFADDYPKNRYIEMAASDAAKYADEIIKMISNAYSSKGGHHEFKSAKDVSGGDVSYWVANDLDKDPEADAVLGGKFTKHGIKMTVMGQDGSSSAKKSAIEKMIGLMKTKGFYAEMDKDLAQKFGLPHIQNEKEIRSIINKEITYNNDGSYDRKVGGKMHTKVLVGIPG